MIFPTDVTVPAPVARGRTREIPIGVDDGEHCQRQNGDGTVCMGLIEYLPDATIGACFCPGTMPPCSYCVSTMPECRRCGWRADDA